MSTPLAGKFQDHYQLLDIDPASDEQVIEETAKHLLAKYDPVNGPHPDEDAYNAVVLAKEVLLDPPARQVFDSLRAGGDKEQAFHFSRNDFFTLLAKEIDRRNALLCILYDRRRLRPFAPTLSIRQIEALMYITAEEMLFTVWYLKKRALVISDDKSNLQISVDGIEFLETHIPSPESVLREIREVPLEPAAPLQHPPPKPKPVEKAAPKPQPVSAPRPEPAKMQQRAPLTVRRIVIPPPRG